MSAPRTFAALIDQDSVVVIEYRQEKAGFRVVDTRSEFRRFSTPDMVADVVVQLLRDSKAKQASLSIVLQHFGSFFHTLMLPPAPDDTIRAIILREVQRSFNITDPAIAFTAAGSGEPRDPARVGAAVPRQVLIAGAPRTVVDTLAARFANAKIRVEGLTVVPEVFRRLYDSLDGSTEATAVLVCLANGPHVAFFVNGKLELAIDPPLALEGEAPLDSTVIMDQLERGAIFLRQQSRGTVATRLLLSAPSADYESLESTIEARTGMRVAPLGRGIGEPEMVVAMGAVLAARAPDRLDLHPRAPTFDARVRRAMTGPSAVSTVLMAAAAIAVIWSGIQFFSLSRTRSDVERLQKQVAASLPAVNAMRESAQGRERIAAIRSNLALAQSERRALGELLMRLAASAPPGTSLDSVSVARVADGLKTTLLGRANGPTNTAAIAAASGLYHFLQRQTPKFQQLDFHINAYPNRSGVDSLLRSMQPAGDQLLFTVSFVAPAPKGQ